MKLNMTSTHVVCIHPSKPSPRGATFFVLLCCEKQFFKVYGPCRKGCTWQDPYLPHNSSKIFVLEFVQVGGTSILATRLVWVCPPTANRNPQSIPINGFFCKFANHKPSLLTRFSSRPNLDHPNQDQGIDDASSTRQQGSGRSISCSILASWQLLEDRLVRENHESKKNCNPFLWERWNFSPFPGKLTKKHMLSFFGGIFACHEKIQDDSTYIIWYNILIHLLPVLNSRHVCMQQTPLNPSGHFFCRASLLAHDPLQNGPWRTGTWNGRRTTQSFSVKTDGWAGWFRWSFPKLGSDRPIFRIFCGLVSGKTNHTSSNPWGEHVYGWKCFFFLWAECSAVITHLLPYGSGKESLLQKELKFFWWPCCKWNQRGMLCLVFHIHCPYWKKISYCGGIPGNYNQSKPPRLVVTRLLYNHGLFERIPFTSETSLYWKCVCVCFFFALPKGPY